MLDFKLQVTFQVFSLHCIRQYLLDLATLHECLHIFLLGRIYVELMVNGAQGSCLRFNYFTLFSYWKICSIFIRKLFNKSLKY